jgi:hypothetical protein
MWSSAIAIALGSGINCLRRVAIHSITLEFVSISCKGFQFYAIAVRLFTSWNNGFKGIDGV